MSETAPWFAPWLGPEILSVAVWALVASAMAAGGIVLLLIPPLRRFAWVTGFLDHPEARKLHTNATPLLGGLGVALATSAGTALGISVLSLQIPAPAVWWTAGALGALVLGLWDDRFAMHAAPKLALQIVVAILFLGGGIYPQALGVLSFPLCLLWLVGMMNAINFLDNMDGIIGGLGFILSIGLGILLFTYGRQAEAVYAFSLSAACLAFLRFNFFPATVFLGDAGSLFIGYSLGALSLIAAYAGPGFQTSAAALLILGYPAFDLCFVIVMRLREGRKVYQGGKDHSTHRLNSLVRGPRRTLMWLYLCAAALTLTGVGLSQAHGTLQVLLWLLVWVFWLLLLGIRLARIPAK